MFHKIKYWTSKIREEVFIYRTYLLLFEAFFNKIYKGFLILKKHDKNRRKKITLQVIQKCTNN